MLEIRKAKLNSENKKRNRSKKMREKEIIRDYGGVRQRWRKQRQLSRKE